MALKVFIVETYNAECVVVAADEVEARILTEAHEKATVTEVDLTSPSIVISLPDAEPDRW